MSREQFSLFRANPKLIFLDYAATTPVPDCVVEAVSSSLQNRAPINRALYPLANEATQNVSESRQQIAKFFGAKADEIIFQNSATAALNQAILGLVDTIKPGDLVITSSSEHHSVLLPLLELVKRTGAILKQIDIQDSGELREEDFTDAKLIALSLVGNVSGTILQTEVLQNIKLQQGSSVTILLDCCQAAPHFRLDFSKLPADICIMAGHKLYGPDGIGILLGKGEVLQTLTPLLGGGGSIDAIKDNTPLWRALPEKLEAGSPNQSAIIGLATAIQWLSPQLPVSDAPLIAIAEKLQEINQVSLVGRVFPASGLLAFTVAGIHAHDVAEFLGERGICVRAGQHCASTFHTKRNLSATIRVSTGIGSQVSDADALADALKELIERFHA